MKIINETLIGLSPEVALEMQQFIGQLVFSTYVPPAYEMPLKTAFEDGVLAGRVWLARELTAKFYWR